MPAAISDVTQDTPVLITGAALTGVTAALVRKAAQPVHWVEVRNGTEEAMKLNMNMDPDPNLRLFYLPQNETEAILVQKPSEHGVHVDYEHMLEQITEDGDPPQATINGTAQACAFVLGAGGVGSTMLSYLGQEMKGYDLPTKWSIADVDAEGWTEPGVFRAYHQG